MATQPAAITNRERRARVNLVVAGLAAAMLLGPGLVRADVVLTATLPPFDPPLANAISRSEPSTLTVLVTNTGSQIVREVDILLPSQYGAVTSSSGPADGTWAATRAGGVAYFRANCSGPGIPPNDSASFVIGFTGSSTSNNGDNPASSPFTVTGFTSSGSNVCDPAPASDSTTFTAPVKALYITGDVARYKNTQQATVTWSVTNNNGSQTVNNIAINAVVTPSTGWSVSNCTTNISSIGTGATQTASCRYTFTVPGTYTFTASARDGNGTGTSSAAGTTAGTFTYGTVPIVTWSKTLVVKGLDSNELTLNVAAPSSANVTQIDVYNDSASGWTLSPGGTTAPPGGSATNGLNYQAPPTSTAADVVLKGTLNQGFSSDIVVTYSGVPNIATGQSYPFRVKVTYAGGPTTVSQSVWLDVPLPDVSQFTIRNDSNGKLLTWTNTSGNGATHDGVVIFREPSGTAPASPVPFKQYSVGQDRVVFFTSGGSAASSFLDTTPGSFNYRICNHDAYYVYSSCSTGLERDAGWLSSEVAPVGGWVVALGGDALVRAGLLPGNHLIGQASNAPAVSALDVATGAQSFAPIPIPSLPSVNSPAAPLRDGSTVLVAADQAGNVTAVDLNTGLLKWPTAFARPAESFTAGVSGVILSSASAQFQADYATDVLLVGSASTGNVYAIDGVTGDELWHIAVGTPASPIHGLITYDPTSNYFYVPTSGLGVKAYDLKNTHKNVPPAATAATWAPDDAGISTGDYRYCLRTASSRGIACLNTGGQLRVVNKTTGKLLAPMFPTGLSFASLARVNGTYGMGFVVSTSTTARVLSFKSTENAVSAVGSPWTATSGVAISAPSVFADSGYFVVGASDRTLYRISLSTGGQLSQSSPITTQNASVLLAQPVYDSASNRFLFGTNDGHLWAVPNF